VALGLAACTNGGDGPIVDPEGADPESPAGSPTLGNQIPPAWGSTPTTSSTWAGRRPCPPSTCPTPFRPPRAPGTMTTMTYAIAESCADLLMVHGVYGIELVLDDRGGLLPDERFDEHAKALTSAFIRALADVLHPDHELAVALPGTVMPDNVLDDGVFELLDHLDFLVPR